MKKLLLLSAVICCIICACGNGTGDGYPADTSDLNTNIDTRPLEAPAGEQGNPDSTIGATTNAKAPDSNATNPNIR